MSKSKFSTLQTSAQQKTGLEGGNKKSQRHPSTCLRHRYAPQPWVLRNFWLYTWTFSRGCQYSNFLRHTSPSPSDSSQTLSYLTKGYKINTKAW